MSEPKKQRRNKYADRDEVLFQYSSRFIKQSETGHNNSHAIHQLPSSSTTNNLTGDEAKCFYESVVLSTEPSGSSSKLSGSSSKLKVRSTTVARNRKKYRKTVIKPPDMADTDTVKRFVAKLFSLCGSEDKVRELSEHVNKIRSTRQYKNVLNSSDQYGWTAAFFAAASDNAEALKMLVEEGAYCSETTDKGGNDVFEICKKNNSFQALAYLESLEMKGEELQQETVIGESGDGALEEKCDLCGSTYNKHLKREHETSLVHLFKDSSKAAPQNVYSIPESNVGFQMMLRSGWEQDSGLGPGGSGRKNPVKTKLKQDRAGFGLNKTKEKITHYNAFDDDAVKTKRQMTKDKAKGTVNRRSKGKKATNEKGSSREWERDLRRYMSAVD